MSDFLQKNFFKVNNKFRGIFNLKKEAFNDQTKLYETLKNDEKLIDDVSSYRIIRQLNKNPDSDSVINIIKNK